MTPVQIPAETEQTLANDSEFGEWLHVAKSSFNLPVVAFSFYCLFS